MNWTWWLRLCVDEKKSGNRGILTCECWTVFHYPENNSFSHWLWIKFCSTLYSIHCFRASYSACLFINWQDIWKMNFNQRNLKSLVLDQQTSHYFWCGFRVSFFPNILRYSIFENLSIFLWITYWNGRNSGKYPMIFFIIRFIWIQLNKFSFNLFVIKKSGGLCSFSRGMPSMDVFFQWSEHVSKT